jgi:hypothetical protein
MIPVLYDSATSFDSILMSKRFEAVFVVDRRVYQEDIMFFIWCQVSHDR